MAAGTGPSVDHTCNNASCKLPLPIMALILNPRKTYKDLEIETTKMWGMKTETIPVVIGALGLTKKGPHL